MKNEIAEILCNALNSDKTLDELAIRLGVVKSQIRRERINFDADREIKIGLEKIEALLEKMIIHGFKEQHIIPSKPVLRVVK